MACVVKRESGFTLQETLVSVNVGFLVVSFGLMLFLSSAKMLGLWQKKSAVRNIVNLIAYRITLDGERSQTAILENDTLLVFVDREQTTHYRFTSGSIIRNDIKMNTDEDIVIDGEILSQSFGTDSHLINVAIVGKAVGFEYRQAVLVKTNPDSKANFQRGI